MKRQSSRSSKKATDTSSFASSEGNDDSASVDIEHSDHKRKSRNLSEKKRRDQFNVLINELCSMVHCDPSVAAPLEIIAGLANNRKMDKSSVLRSAIDFLKNHTESNAAQLSATGVENVDQSMSNQGPCDSNVSDSWKPCSLSYEEFAQLLLEALDAFILIIEADTTGNIIYASESILPLLGHNPSKFFHRQGCYSDTRDAAVRKVGTSIFELLHESDHASFSKMLAGHDSDSVLDPYQSAMLHFKQNSSSNTYELVRLLGSFYTISESSGKETRCLVSIGRLQSPKLLKELRMVTPPTCEPLQNNKEFVSRHSLEWKFLFLDLRAPALIGYMPFEVLGTSGYDYYHWDDLDVVVSGHEQLMQTGEGTSQHYRFLTKGQQWIWLQTKYYITYHQWNSKPEFIVCTHTITGYDEDRRPTPTSELNLNEAFAQRISHGSTGSTSSVSSRESPAPSTTSSKPHSSTKPKSKYKYSTSSYDKSEGISSMVPPASSGESSDASSSRPGKHRTRDSLGRHGSACPPVTSTALERYSQINSSSRQKAASSMALSHQVQSSNKTQVQDFLRRKHVLLQRHIQQQQEELRRVSEQLMLVQFAGDNSQEQPGDGDASNQNSAAITDSSTTLPNPVQSEDVEVAEVPENSQGVAFEMNVKPKSEFL